MQPQQLRRWLGPLLLLALATTVLAGFKRGSLPPPEAIEPALLEAPRQQALSDPSFTFEYKEKLCHVQPLASYELWGLVVSHNNIHSVADIYHDSTSVDTKDLCVIWGRNITQADYRSVEFDSGPWTCYFRYPGGTEFFHHAIGNNHLITDDPVVRRELARVRVGDQVHLEGRLVNYQMDDWQGFWRRTSTSRQDDDCEVVFLEKIAILRRGTPGWYLLYRLGWLAMLATPILYLALIWIEAGRPDSSTLGRL